MSSKVLNCQKHLLFIMKLLMKKIMTLMINFTKKNMKIKFVDFKEIME